MPYPHWLTAGESPNCPRPSDRHHHDGLVAGYRSILVTTTGAVEKGFCPPVFHHYHCCLSHFSVPSSHLWSIKLPKRLPLAEAELLRSPKTPIVTTIVIGDVVIPSNNSAHFRLFFRPTGGQDPSITSASTSYVDRYWRHPPLHCRLRFLAAGITGQFARIRVCQCKFSSQCPSSIVQAGVRPINLAHFLINLDEVNSAQLSLVQPIF